MTKEEFDQIQNRPCDRCRGNVVIERNPNNNALQVVCGQCAARVPWRELGVLNLKQNNKKRRVGYPFGEDLDDVWARFGDRCVVCSRHKDELKLYGVGRQRQHVAPYVEAEHAGPIVPICSRCHEIATALQRDAAVMRGFIRFSRTHAEPVSHSRPDLPGAGLSPDPVPVEGQDPFGVVEGLPDDDAFD